MKAVLLRNSSAFELPLVPLAIMRGLMRFDATPVPKVTEFFVHSALKTSSGITPLRIAWFEVSK